MRSVHFRFPEQLVERLDGLAGERGVNRSRLVRQLLEAGLQNRLAALSEPPSEEELVSILAERARNGNVAAVRSLLARLEEQNPRERVLAEFRRMAEARRQ